MGNKDLSRHGNNLYPFFEHLLAILDGENPLKRLRKELERYVEWFNDLEEEIEADGDEMERLEECSPHEWTKRDESFVLLEGRIELLRCVLTGLEEEEARLAHCANRESVRKLITIIVDAANQLADFPCPETAEIPKCTLLSRLTPPMQYLFREAILAKDLGHASTEKAMRDLYKARSENLLDLLGLSYRELLPIRKIYSGNLVIAFFKDWHIGFIETDEDG